MVLQSLPLDDLTPASLWAELDEQTRREAGEALYRGARHDLAGRQEADRAIASALHFREVAVRKLPANKRIDYVTRSVRADDSLASTLLLALHLEERVPLLAAFLEELEIPHDGGMVDEDYDLDPPAAERLEPAVESLYGKFPAGHVELYLACLIAMDPETWGGLVPVLRRRPAS